MSGQVDTVTVITLLTGLISFLTFALVGVIAWVITRMQKSIDRSHIRIDDLEKDVRVNYMSEAHCKSKMKGYDAKR